MGPAPYHRNRCSIARRHDADSPPCCCGCVPAPRFALPRRAARTGQRSRTRHPRCAPLPGSRLRQRAARPVRRTGDRGRGGRPDSGHGHRWSVSADGRVGLPARRPALEQWRSARRAAGRGEFPARVRAGNRGAVRRAVRCPAQRARGAGGRGATDRAGCRGAGRAHGGVHARPQRTAAGAADPADGVPGISARGGAVRRAAHPTRAAGLATAPTGSQRGPRRRTWWSNATRISMARAASRSHACASTSPRTPPPNCSASPPATCTSPKWCRRSRCPHCASASARSCASRRTSARSGWA